MTALWKTRPAWYRPNRCAAVLCLLAFASGSAIAQNIAPAGDGPIQAVKSGVGKSVSAGTIARAPGGEKAGAGGFGTSETKGRVVSGRAAGYGTRQVSGRLGEYGSLGGAGFGGSRDFPSTDFVATMPLPQFGASTLAPAPAFKSGLGMTLTTPPPPARYKRKTAAHKPAHPQMKDPNAILNPFTHTIGGGLGANTPSLPTVLGASH